MPLGRMYKVGVFDTSTWLPTGATVTVTTTTPILYVATASTSDLNISAVRCGILGASTFPSNASVVFSLNTVTGSVGAGFSFCCSHMEMPSTIGSSPMNTECSDEPIAGAAGRPALWQTWQRRKERGAVGARRPSCRHFFGAGAV